MQMIWLLMSGTLHFSFITQFANVESIAYNHSFAVHPRHTYTTLRIPSAICEQAKSNVPILTITILFDGGFDGGRSFW